VSLDEPGSGTLVDARIILDAYGLSEDDLEAAYVKPSVAVAQMRDGELDAFIIVAGYPTGSVVELCATIDCELVPFDGPQADALLKDYRFFAKDTIPAGTYAGVPETPTLSVGAQWVVGAEVDEDLVYGITKALWHHNARRLLDDGHAKGRSITLETALDGVGIPLHPGAERYYREAGMLP
jgi:TRAP transporter TAXI family solute receptor